VNHPGFHGAIKGNRKGPNRICGKEKNPNWISNRSVGLEEGGCVTKSKCPPIADCLREKWTTHNFDRQVYCCQSFRGRFLVLFLFQKRVKPSCWLRCMSGDILNFPENHVGTALVALEGTERPTLFRGQHTVISTTPFLSFIFFALLDFAPTISVGNFFACSRRQFCCRPP